MKMKDRRLKYLDRLGMRVMDKTSLSGKPTNRAERRRFGYILKREHVTEDEINQDAIFEALKERKRKR